MCYILLNRNNHLALYMTICYAKRENINANKCDKFARRYLAEGCTTRDLSPSFTCDISLYKRACIVNSNQMQVYVPFRTAKVLWSCFIEFSTRAAVGKCICCNCRCSRRTQVCASVLRVKIRVCSHIAQSNLRFGVSRLQS